MALARGFFKKIFLTGLIVAIPGAITILLVIWFFNLIDSIMSPLYDKAFGYHVPGIGFVSAIALIFIVGAVATNVIGRRIIGFLERLFLKMPIFKGIYTSVKHIVNAFSPEAGKSSFRRFVIVEYPRQGTYAFGFLTKECLIKKGKAELALSAVYIPTNNLYLGEVVLVGKEDIFHTDIPVEEGIKIILSGGIATPPEIKEAGS
ncbi:MAG: DUF502 domain-containing protein [Nitrospirae bacterium]|nr:DUF502 domain-containing protein [Nitrospirota bacterium]